MNNPIHVSSCISGLRRRVKGAALAFAIMLVLATVLNGSAQAQTYSVLYSFTGSPDGANPYAGLLRDTQGNLYGTTELGGASGAGTVFKVDTTGRETVLYSFTGIGGDGAAPRAGLVQDAQGNLYGTTAVGGDLVCNASHGCGTVFKVDTTGKETVLYSFTWTGKDGAYPNGTLAQDAQGNLYGTTYQGGKYVYFGMVFKLDATGKEKVLHSFSGNAAGANPFAGVVLDSQGNLYGTTEFGGHGGGTVYQVNSAGNRTVLHKFRWLDGADSSASLVLDAQGNLYGTTDDGGAYGYGTVFKLDTAGKETVLYSFTGTGGDGANPYASVVRDAQGNLYGTTLGGGASGNGTVFKVDTAGNETVLHSFGGFAGDGELPLGSLVLDDQGNLYGTTYQGGDPACNAPYGCGTVFKLTP